MVAFFLSVRKAEVLKCVVVNLFDIFHSLIHSFLVASSCKMNINEGEGSVIKIKSDTNWTFVSSYSWETAFDFDFSELPEIIFVLAFGHHDNVTSNH